VTVIVDASALIAQVDASDPAHEGVVAILTDDPGPFVTSQFAVAEADHVIDRLFGSDVEAAFAWDVAEGSFAAECLTPVDLEVAAALADRYRDLRLGLADASLVVLAARHGTDRLLTLDERHFRVVPPLQGGAFRVLPADG
jgi:hypothetical protein